MIRLDLNQLEVTTFAVREPEDPAVLQPPPTIVNCSNHIYCPVPVDPVTQNGCETGAGGYC